MLTESPTREERPLDADFVFLAVVMEARVCLELKVPHTPHRVNMLHPRTHTHTHADAYRVRVVALSFESFRTQWW